MHKFQIKESDVFSMSMSECSVCELYTRVPVSEWTFIPVSLTI